MFRIKPALALVVVLGGLLALRSPAQAEGRMYSGCTRCTDGYACGLEASLCEAWGCGHLAQPTCGEFGSCNQANGKVLIVCNNINDQ